MAPPRATWFGERVDHRSRAFLKEAAAHAEAAQKLIDEALERAQRSVIDLRDAADVDAAQQVPEPREAEA
jgi:hypothetical protein